MTSRHVAMFRQRTKVWWLWGRPLLIVSINMYCELTTAIHCPLSEKCRSNNSTSGPKKLSFDHLSMQTAFTCFKHFDLHECWQTPPTVIMQLLIINWPVLTPDQFQGSTKATVSLLLTLTMLNFWKFTSYCSLKPLWSGMGEVVPARTSPTLHPLPLCINCRD